MAPFPISQEKVMDLDQEFEDTAEALEEFSKDYMLQHVLAELTLMRTMLEMMRIQLEEIKSGRTQTMATQKVNTTTGTSPIAPPSLMVNTLDVGDYTITINGQQIDDVESFEISRDFPIEDITLFGSTDRVYPKSA